MLGVNRSSHLSPVGDTNSLNQVLYLDPVPYFVFADGSWYTVMYGSIESAQFSRQRCLIFSTSGLVRSKNQPKLPPLMGQKHRPNRANPIMKSSSRSATNVVRVLIADDHPVVREGLVTILKSEKDISHPASHSLPLLLLNCCLPRSVNVGFAKL